MPNTLILKTRLENGKFIVEATVKPGSDVPSDIFIYEKTDKGKLGDYVGIAFVDDLARIKPWDPTITSNFGSRYTRYSVGTAKLSSSAEQVGMVDHMKTTFAALVDQYKAGQVEVVEEYAV